MKSHKSASTARPAQRKRPLISQRGYSIIELSIALAILAVIIIGGLLGVQTILRNNRTNEMLKNTPIYLANATKVNASQAVIATNTFNLADLGAFPASYVSGAAGARLVNHEHGGRIFVEANTAAVAGVPIGQTFVLTLTSIPQAACVDLASGLEGLSLSLNVVDNVGVLRTSTPGAGSNVKPANGVLNLANLATQCNSAGAKEMVAVVSR